MAGEVPSFAELIEKAQATPPGKQRDVANPFGVPLPKGEKAVVLGDPKIPGNSEYDFEAHVEMLCIGEDGAAEAYERILNMALRGECIIRSEDKNFTKEGDFLVVIQYLTYKPKAKKKRVGSDRDQHD